MVLSRHVAFLRSINVGGRRVTGDQLTAPLEAAGLQNVATFLASGNVIFDVDGAHAAGGLEEQVSVVLGAALGFDVPVFVRTAAQVEDLVAAEPFTAAEVEGSTGKPQVTLLKTPPTAAAWKKTLAMETAEDLIRRGEQAWFWLPAEGISGTKLHLAAVEKQVGVGTTRTRNTLARIAKKFF